MLTIQQIVETVNKIAKDYPITKVMLFGSYATGANTADSDVDLLVEFSVSAVSLFTLADIKIRLEEILNTEVDVIRAPLPENSLIELEKVVEIYAA